MDDAADLCLVDDLPQLSRRADTLAGHHLTDAERAQHHLGGALEHPNRRPQRPAQHRDRPGDPEKDRLGAVKRDRLGHQLPEDDTQIRHRAESDQERKPDRGAIAKDPADSRRRHRPGQDADRGDPDLHGGDDSNRIVHQVKRRPRTPVTGRRQRGQRPATGSDHGVLPHHEERVRHHEQYQQHKQQGIHPLKDDRSKAPSPPTASINPERRASHWVAAICSSALSLRGGSPRAHGRCAASRTPCGHYDRRARTALREGLDRLPVTELTGIACVVAIARSRRSRTIAFARRAQATAGPRAAPARRPRRSRRTRRPTRLLAFERGSGGVSV